MADSNVAITAGSGTSIDTQVPTGGDHRQVVVLGDPGTIANVMPIVAKGTQGGFAAPVQQLHNSGRTLFALRSGARTAGVTTEALLSLIPNRAGVAGTQTTTFPVTSGKILRLTGMNIAVSSTAAAVAWFRICLRMNPTTACSATDPIIIMHEVGTDNATASVMASAQWSFGSDGIEVSGTQQIGITQVASATTAQVSLSVWGYEY